MGEYSCYSKKGKELQQTKHNNVYSYIDTQATTVIAFKIS